MQEPTRARFSPHRRTVRVGVDQRDPVFPDLEVLRGEAENLDQPVGEHELDAADVHVRPAVEIADQRIEIPGDNLAARSSLGSQFTLLRIEIPVDDGEIDDPLEGRQELVDGDDQRTEMLPHAFLVQRMEVGLAAIHVGVDQQGVVFPVIPDQEDPPHRLHVPEHVLDPLRSDRLALDVLVDLLLAIDQP